jgi:hypothetical protein
MLIRLPAQLPLLEALVSEGWVKGWGVYLTSPATPEEIRQYFRQSLMINTEDGREFFFRFYDPAFLRHTLRAPAGQDVLRFFGPVSSFLVEAERPDILLQFTRTGGSVEATNLPLLPVGQL